MILVTRPGGRPALGEEEIFCVDSYPSRFVFSRFYRITTNYYLLQLPYSVVQSLTNKLIQMCGSITTHILVQLLYMHQFYSLLPTYSK
jgi:hypothetical protein